MPGHRHRHGPVIGVGKGQHRGAGNNLVVVHQLAVVPRVPKAAELLPAVWLLNRVSDVYLSIAGVTSGLVAPPEDYLPSLIK